jgi:phosphoribosylglycinamide formyltransferase-1
MTLTIGVLASTRGTDLQELIDLSEAGKLDVKIACVISDKKEAYALERARKHRIEAIFIDPKGKKRETFDKEAAALLEARGVKVVVLIGYMRLFSSWFVEKYRNRIMNIHPSLLPLFPGMDRSVHEEVLNAGVKITGCTVHFVDEGKDTGPIILQEAVPVLNGDTVDSLKDRVQAAEKRILPQAIRLFAGNRLVVEGNKVRILS